MKSRVQEEIPQVTFTMLRGGKGYLVEEVNVYIETIRSAYLVLESEYNAVTEENAQLLSTLEQLKSRPTREEDGAFHKKQSDALRVELKMINEKLRKVQEATTSTAPEVQQMVNQLSAKLAESESQRKLLLEKLAGLESSNEALLTQREKIAGITEELQKRLKHFKEQQSVLENELQDRDDELKRLRQMQLERDEQEKAKQERVKQERTMTAREWLAAREKPAAQERPVALWEKPAVQERPVNAWKAPTMVQEKPTFAATEARPATQRRTGDMLRSAHEELAEIRRQFRLGNAE